ncbi:electron transport complex subunit RsxC [Dysgonomonas sp. Marseille-P4677]|uniref:electron transport complex subunit RsxC n=1 Tax=Dysgonomonas sp. Marseille-P4677 TaxID=2364790 RepID=UPI001911475D|nr:electron transport complex subunit RsxC [Dysgonomonas sp. Marseille-P4677]MBK5719982.1 electron transport complex subunit RsxC [Dysgonomonas sp. Marseille-P4677]
MMHIFSMKRKTKKMKIRSVEDAPIFYIPLQKYYGSLPEPVIKVGDRVKKYQLIGRSSNLIPANVHSPVSGTVMDIKEMLQSDGLLTLTIIISNDYQEESIIPPNDTVEDYSVRELIQLIEDAGIVGEGGAQYPASLKYKLEGKAIHTFIINGTECEPYLTADYALMAERTEELFKGINIVNKILCADDVVISIEEQNKDLLKVFTPYLHKEEYRHFRVVILPNEYPQGGELQLIKSVTGIEMPRVQRPRDVGVIVSNVGTVYAVYNAVVNRYPVISRIITVSGEQADNTGNYDVKIGTPISHLVNILGISLLDKTVVLGGPMMGRNIADWNIPISKGSSGVLLFRKEKVKRSNCISCGYCVDVCPMNLMPMKFEENFRQKKYFNLEKYSISNCIECAACEYICPSNVSLIESIKEGKIKLKQLADAIQ